jgi:hypothetical protein
LIELGFESTLINLGILVALLGMAVFVYVVVKFRDGSIDEEPSELQFANQKNIPGEDYVDLNVVKVGKTKTLGTYHSSGFISWEAFFNPKTREDMEKRKPATIALAVVYGVFAVMGVMMRLLDIPIGVYFVGGMQVLLSVLVIIKFLQHGLRK